MNPKTMPDTCPICPICHGPMPDGRFLTCKLQCGRKLEQRRKEIRLKASAKRRKAKERPHKGPTDAELEQRRAEIMREVGR